MSIEAKVIADSINTFGNRLTTFQLRYPRFIHAEFMTHRLFSRNARSSRAVPTKKLIEEVRKDPAMPCHWGKNQPGMQANEELQGEDRELAMTMWCQAADWAALQAEKMLKKGIHKQVVNRILEPFLHIDVVVSATEWDNFFALRRHKDAQPEIRALADAMWEAREKSTPKLLAPGQWHLPYVDADDFERAMDFSDGTNADMIATLQKLSVARCARVSYKVFEEDRRPTLYEDKILYNRLVGSQPMHASPAEHQATPDVPYRVNLLPDGRVQATSNPLDWQNYEQHGNFVGWRQYRKMLPGECVKEYKVIKKGA